MKSIEQLNPQNVERTGLEVAVIGMAGRFPGANSIDEFWRNLQQSVESISSLEDMQLLAQGVSAEALEDPNYVKVGGVLKDVDLFDAAFFGFSPREAEILDPQQRLFLETAATALETAGYDADRYAGNIGVYGGAGMNGYLLNLYSSAVVRDRVSPYELFISNDKDFLTTRVSYKLNLKGPSVDVQTACSSSLVAVHMACQSLLSGECDMALAGGVAISKQLGYRVQEGSIYSSDGHCRAFDAQASGTVSGNGVGIVVLKRLEDALAAGDTIDAVIKGSAINNDGALKVSYTAPCVEAQAAVIRAAQTMAEVSPQSISYVEAHGTGTALGDPIELAALTQAFVSNSNIENSVKVDSSPACAIGSVKTNIGHLDAASGISGFIKTVLALKHKQIPASLHFQQPNPNIDFHNSPFYVNAALSDWSQSTLPRRAGVSSFGIGGTNAHVVLEEAPVVVMSPTAMASSDKQPQLLVLSAKTPAALDVAAINLSAYLSKALENNRSDISLADVTYTLQIGRRAFEYRRSIVCQTASEAVEQLRDQTAYKRFDRPSLVFLFSGQGSQYANMAKDLYETQPVFQQTLDQCAVILSAEGIDLQALLYSETGTDETFLQQTSNAQPILFAIEYALAQLWLSWGLKSAAMLGHSLGEYVAACSSGVFDLKTALKLVTLRGKLMQQMAKGAMLSVAISAEKIVPWLTDELVLAVNNGPQLCVVSGDEGAIASLQSQLEQNNVSCHLLHTSHAFHSPMMEPMLVPFTEAVSRVKLNPPKTPFISSVTGTWITAEEATNPDYWSRQVRQTVRFSEGIATLSHLPDPVFLEIGPGNTLTKLAQQQLSSTDSFGHHSTIYSLPHPNSEATDTAQMLSALGKLWSAGVSITWEAVCAERSHRRIPLPTYPFERQRYWIDFEPTALANKMAEPQMQRTTQPETKTNLADWFYIPSWERHLPVVKAADSTKRPCWLIFADDEGIGQQLAQKIEHLGQDVFTVLKGDEFEQAGYRKFRLNPGKAKGFSQLLGDLQLREIAPTEIVYLWPVVDSDKIGKTEQFTALMTLLKAWSTQSESLQITVVTESAYDVVGSETLNPEQAEIQGLCQVVGQEYPFIGCRQVDLAIANYPTQQIAQMLWQELQVESPSAVVAYRGRQTAQSNVSLANRHRWQKTYQAVCLPDGAPKSSSRQDVRLKKEGLYIIVGSEGLGQIWEHYLTERYQANVVHIEEIDMAAIQAKLKQAVDEFGLVHGVFVSSPMTNEKSAAPVALLQPHHWDYSCKTKKVVLQNLAIALQPHSPHFCCVQSSLSSIIGGLGLAAYAGANHFIDAFVTQQNQQSAFPWFSINWDAHLDSSTDKNNDNASSQSGWGASLADFALTPEEVWQATERILTQGLPGQTIVSKRDLLARYQKWIHATPQQAAAQSKGQLDAPSATSQKLNEQTSASHLRPQLSTQYIAPRSDAENTIVEIWKDLLGLEEIGVNDSFFDLGGHSLLAIQVISRLREAFPVEIEMRTLLFESPTVAKIAAVITEQLPKESEIDEMAALLAEVQALSTKEVNAQLTGGDA